MTDFDERLIRELTYSSGESDEDFVRDVTRRIDANEKMRVLALTLLTLAVVCLASALCVGLLMAWSAWGALAMPVTATTSTVTPLLSIVLMVLVAILALPLACSEE
jgi:hypothetical protein